MRRRYEFLDLSIGSVQELEPSVDGRERAQADMTINFKSRGMPDGRSSEILDELSVLATTARDLPVVQRHSPNTLWPPSPDVLP